MKRNRLRNNIELFENEILIHENDFLSYSFIGNILVGRYKNGVYIDLSIAKSIAIDRDLLLQKHNIKKTFVIAEVSNLKGISSEARIFFSQDKQNEKFLAAALVTESLTGYVLAKFYMKLVPNKLMPENMFRTIPNAIEWLNKLNIECQK